MAGSSSWQGLAKAGGGRQGQSRQEPRARQAPPPPLYKGDAHLRGLLRGGGAGGSRAGPKAEGLEGPPSTGAAGGGSQEGLEWEKVASWRAVPSKAGASHSVPPSRDPGGWREDPPHACCPTPTPTPGHWRFLLFAHHLQALIKDFEEPSFAPGFHLNTPCPGGSTLTLQGIPLSISWLWEMHRPTDRPQLASGGPAVSVI